MKKSLRQRLLAYLEKQEGFIASGELQRLGMQAGYTAQNVGRRLRECQEDGLLEVEYRNPHNHAWYRAKNKKKPVTYQQVMVDGRPIMRAV